MTRLLLLVLFGLAVSYYLPDSRQVLLDATAPLTNRVVMWATRDEMGSIAQAVVEHERLTGELPDRRAWQRWLNWRYTADESKKDPWGSIYQIYSWADSIAIISYGPDRERETNDDFRVIVNRERRR